eukprot:COSAG05_NODE_2693_length_2765_cov_2.085896_3_plen_46_part_01
MFGQLLSRARARARLQAEKTALEFARSRFLKHIEQPAASWQSTPFH